jgi:AraC-like DNA-binding protein
MLYEPSTLAMTTNLLAASLREEYFMDPAPVFAEAGLDVNKVLTPQCRYPLSQVAELWQAAKAATDDPLIGLKTGWYATPTDFYAFGFSWLASGTLLDGMQRLCRYYQTLSTAAVEIDLREAGDLYGLSASFPDESRCPPKEGIDAGMTALLKLCKVVAGEEVFPERIELVCDDTVHPDDYRDHLGAPISFGHDVGTFYFSRKRLEARLHGDTPDVARATDKIAEQYLETLDPLKVASMVRRLLVALLPAGEVDQDMVAKRLNRSTSTLQRQLQSEGLSYRDILDGTRLSLAQEYLNQRKLSHAQIAYLLGFSDQSNFSRAFKRWTSQSPREFQSSKSPQQQAS